MFVIRLSGDARMPNPLLRGPHAEQFIATGCSHRIKNRLAAAAAIHFPARCHHWQRPLPIMSPPAANRKSMAFFPLGQCARPNLPTPLSLLSCAYQSAIPTFLIPVALSCGMIIPLGRIWGAAEVLLVRKTDKNKNTDKNLFSCACRYWPHRAPQAPAGGNGAKLRI